MNKLKVAIWLKENYSPETGGGFSYYEHLIKQIDQFNFDELIDIVFISYKRTSGFVKNVINISENEISKRNWTTSLRIAHKFCSLPGIRKLKFGNKLAEFVNGKTTKDIESILSKNLIDLVYFPVPTDTSLNYPYILTHWDIGHKSMYCFPEVSMNGIYEKRHNYHSNTLQKAFAIFTESEQSKLELLHYERINAERIYTVPLIYGSVVETNVSERKQNEILSKWNLTKNNFFFYPAQFWSHKNHYILLKACKILKSEYPLIKWVFTGSDKGNLSYIKEQIIHQGLENEVIITGFVSFDEIYTLYKNTLSLTMPTYLGPTNMPLLEAKYLGCNVICSNLKGHKEQLGDYADYFNPSNENELVTICKNYLQNGKNTLPELKKINLAESVNSHLIQLYNVRKTFGLNFDQE